MQQSGAEELTFRMVDVVLDRSNNDGQPMLEPVGGEKTGISFVNRLSPELHLRNQISLNGSGVAAADVDGDGLCDLYFCGLESDNRLYRNLGNWRFEDITDRAGAACESRLCTGAVMVDFNGDFHVDILVNTIGQGTLVLVNRGNGTFVDVTQGVGFNRGRAGMSFAVADMNGDQYLDFYITNYRTHALMDQPGTRFNFDSDDMGRKRVSRVNGVPVAGTENENRFLVKSDGAIRELGEADVVYINEAGRRFQPLSLTDPMFRNASGTALDTELFDWGLSARFHDINRDGLPDLYVCNDFETPDRLWIQKKPGLFQLAPESLFHRTSFFSMGVDMGDVNRDGWDDIFVLDMLPLDPADRHNILDAGPAVFEEEEFKGPPQFSWNTLLLNSGARQFIDIGPFSGLAASGWSWATALVDLDLDGWDDVLVTNGVERDGRNLDVSGELSGMRQSGRFSNAAMFEARRKFPRLATRDLVFRNRGNLTFEPMEAWGFSAEAVSNGMALADLDNDGDLDVVVNRLNDPAGIYRNNASVARVQVRLLHQSPNTRGIGARIEFRNGRHHFTRQIAAGGRYLSSDQPVAQFAVPDPAGPCSVTVFWPDGISQPIQNVRPDTIIEAIRLQSTGESIKSAESGPTSVAFSSQPATPLLKLQSTSRLESAPVFNSDPERELSDATQTFSFSGPSGQLSYTGTGIAVFNGYGYRLDAGSDTLSMRAQPLPSTNSAGRLIQRMTHDSWTVDLHGLRYSSGIRHAEIHFSIGGSDQRSGFSLREGHEPSCMAMGDIEGDGNPEVFVAFSHVQGKPSQTPGLAAFRLGDGDNGQGQSWEPAPELEASLRHIGPALDLALEDLDEDGRAELLVPIFLHQKPVVLDLDGDSGFRDIAGDLGIRLPLGPWTSVTVISNATGTAESHPSSATATAVLFGNFGRNNSLSTTGAATVVTVMSPEDHQGRPFQFEAIQINTDSGDPGLIPFTRFDTLVKQLPVLARRYTSRQQFAHTPVADLIPGKYQTVPIESLDSVLLVRPTGSRRFVRRPLPEMVNLWPVMDACAGDVDGDGTTDLLLATGWESARPHDSMPVSPVVPLFLKGASRNRFQYEVMLPHESGIEGFFTTLAVEMADLDGDGRDECIMLDSEGILRVFSAQRQP